MVSCSGCCSLSSARKILDNESRENEQLYIIGILPGRGLTPVGSRLMNANGPAASQAHHSLRPKNTNLLILGLASGDSMCLSQNSRERAPDNSSAAYIRPGLIMGSH
jgi:hypothetical protein